MKKDAEQSRQSADPKPQTSDSQVSTDICPRCGESADLALIKGCLRCLKCGFKWDCNGW